MECLFAFLLIRSIHSTPRVSLHYTDEFPSSVHDPLPHHCLRVLASPSVAHIHRQLISFCLSEPFPPTDSSSSLTFADLEPANITSEEMYTWSVPIDIVERYQLYLNDKSTANETFFNYTSPRFGPKCEYELVAWRDDQPSLNEIVDRFFRGHIYAPYELTCYEHLRCDRGPSPACLDWTEICNGRVDCLDGNFDEELCWQLELNECNEKEYRCRNGQCIPLSFADDDVGVPDCLDASDLQTKSPDSACAYHSVYKLSFRCDDVVCSEKPLTSSCTFKRDELLFEAMFSQQDPWVINMRWAAFKCVLPIAFGSVSICDHYCEGDECLDIIERFCPPMIYIPFGPILFNDIRFAYRKEDARVLVERKAVHAFICYNNTRYDPYFVDSVRVIFGNDICYQSPHEHAESVDRFQWDAAYISTWVMRLRQYHHVFNYTPTICTSPAMYQCVRSVKCISRHRLKDVVADCPYYDDRLPIPKYAGVDVTYLSVFEHARKTISFQTICDGYVELLPVEVGEDEHTDESECDRWQCDNIYTRCNGLWNCLNGADELGCDESPYCPSDRHVCVSANATGLLCLPVGNANDGQVDCLGAVDEPSRCRETHQQEYQRKFWCEQDGSPVCVHLDLLCERQLDCGHAPHRRFCSTQESPSSWTQMNMLHFLQHWRRSQYKEPVVYFSLVQLSNSTRTSERPNRPIIPMQPMPFAYQPHCHRGLELRVRSGQSIVSRCLCPPGFYGDHCQYENQRVHLTVRIRVPSHSRQQPFAIVISLIDDSPLRTVHSVEQFTHLGTRDCDLKYHLYLLYATRPKNITFNYFVHIDIYEKMTMIYRGSLFFPLDFPFLPVHRLALIVDVPRSDDVQLCSTRRCVHGRCVKYDNRPEQSFCQCHPNWSGQSCELPHRCTCSSTSVCLGVWARNRSICVCPSGSFGPRCLIPDTRCQSETKICENNGVCLTNDELSGVKPTVTCICPDGFVGERCEILSAHLTFTIGQDIAFDQSVFIHFISVMPDAPPIRATTFKSMLSAQRSISIHWTQRFHLVFVELKKTTYYLGLVQTEYNVSASMSTTITADDRCYSIGELFNRTIVELPLLRRIKLYHLACRNSIANVSCFHDERHLCICYDDDRHGRLANCFEFDHSKTFDCSGQSECRNEGQCFEDHPSCPRRSICVCRSCFYGTLCQFSTSGFGLSLDSILGYHISPRMPMLNQSAIVQVAAVLAMLFVIVGAVDGVLTFITFKNQSLRQVGCGLYLYSSSVITLIIVLLLGVKFWVLVVGQMKPIVNRTFLHAQCASLDFLLRVMLNVDQWLTACVAFERAFVAVRETKFSKKKSRQAAKKILGVLLIVVMGSAIVDPLHRRLVIEENESGDRRIWCTVDYPRRIEIVNSAVNIVHFFGPFVVNLVAATILVIKNSRVQANARGNRRRREVLVKQLREHRHLFLGPVLLVALALPRLILTFVSQCMKSAHDSWLFLAGYFLSFVPSVLTFVLFVTPSKLYRDEFVKSVAVYRTNLLKTLRA